MGDRRTAEQLYNQAVTALADRTQADHLQHGYQLMSSAVFNDPSFGLGWYGLGNANNDIGQMTKTDAPFLACIAAYRQALQCDLDTDLAAKTLVNLGWTEWQVGCVADARESLKAGLAIDAKASNGWLSLGCVEATYNNRDYAIECMRKAVAFAPDDPVAHMGLAFRLLEAGQYEEGFREYEWRFKYKLHQFLQYPYPKWDGTRGQTLFLVADQGLGDTLSFARFVPMAAATCKYIHMVIQPELMRCFSQAFAHIPNLNIIPLSSPFLQADAWSTFMSLPSAMALSDEQVRTTPQIAMPTYSMPTSWMVPDRKLHIGIAWAGSPLNDIDKHRSIPVTQFFDLYRVPGIQLYSLQVGERSKDLETTGAVALIRNLAPYIQDVTDTVAILRDLDLVICCESALGHICSSAGKECWIPYSHLGRDWRLEQKLWTPLHRVFSQGSDLQWAPVFREIEQALREKLGV